MKNIRIGEVLKEYGYINDDQLQEALDWQANNKGKRLGEILMEMGFVNEKQILQAMAKRLELPLTDLPSRTLNIEAVRQIPKQMAQKYNLIATECGDGVLEVAMSDPLNFYAIEDVRQYTHQTVNVVLDIKANIDKAIDKYYAEVATKDVFRKMDSASGPDTETDVLSLDSTDDGDDAPVVRALNNLLIQAYRAGASDVHIEPFRNHIQVRMRVDGVITEMVRFNTAIQMSLIARIKILAGMDIAERRLPQDGHFQMHLEGKEINTRVSVIPTVFGEKAVIRFLYTNAIVDSESTFGMTPENYEKFGKMLASPHGIIYITGPTGSGKTTTLYMVLEKVSQRAVNVSTIEDPVERNLPSVNQMQVNNVAGLTFESGLRALMRQDPDVIMVGETRDSETANISVRAAITGHQVFSTLHTNDAVSAVVRLRDMGVPSYMVANSVVGLVAQRLMRKVCPHCTEKYKASEAELEALGLPTDSILMLKRGLGCSKCSNTGYRGRRSIHEMVVIDAPVRRMITKEADLSDIRAYLRKEQNFRSLRDEAAELVVNGVTSMEEYYKIAYYASEED